MMKNFLSALKLLCCISPLAMLASCGNKPVAPPQFPAEVFPTAPTRLRAIVDSAAINLDWSFSGSAPVAQYNIYRQEGAGETPALIGTSAQRQFTDGDDDLVQNREYGYSVSAVLGSGYEGPRSEVSFTVFAPGGLPSEVFLLTPVALDTFPVALQLSWAASPDSNNFAAYQIYRSLTPAVDLNSTAVAIVANRLQVSYIDRGLQSSTVYYYRLFVFNRAGRFSASNVVTVQTPTNTPPAAVTLSQPVFISGAGMRLTWSRNGDRDFASYRVYRSTATPVDTGGLPLAIINDATTTTYEDRGVSSGALYYYSVAVYDRGGLFTKSNEVSGRAQ